MPKKTQFLTAEEEFNLARRWREKGDVRARDRLVMSYRPFALRQAEIAFKAGRGALEDLTQEATLALLEAAQNFDPDKGWRFSTYARFSVQQRLNRYHFDMSGPLRVGTTQADKRALYRFPRLRAEWEAKHGRDLDDEGRRWIAEQGGFSLDVLRDVEAHLRGNYVALDAPAFDDSSATVGDTLEDEEVGADGALRSLLESERAELLAWALERLPERERQIIEMRFGLGSRAGQKPEMLQTIAVLHGVTRERVRQIEQRAIRLMQEMIASAPNRAGRQTALVVSQVPLPARLPAVVTPEVLERARAKAKALASERRAAEKAYRAWARQAQLRLIDRCESGGWVLAGSISGSETRAAA